jgi:predicted transcriptional regulator
MSQQSTLAVLTPEWRSTAEVLEAANASGTPYAASTIGRNLQALHANGMIEREYRKGKAYWRLRP